MQLSGWTYEKLFKIQDNIVISEIFSFLTASWEFIAIDSPSSYGELILKKSEILEISLTLRIKLWNQHIKH